VDDDCDGAADEEFVATPTSCGVGACASTGITTCTGGVPGDTCTPGTPVPSDATCDGLDDDCDGTADEDFVATPTSCGVGACTFTGMTTCVSGTPGDTCTPGTPATSDGTCDGLDDDCDGTADEDFTPVATSCGVGACASTGITTCTGGVPGDTCTPGAPAPSDSTCDGLDDDCDGTADEDFVAVPTSCGVGACASTGITTCTGGVPGDTCTPGAPAPSDSTCDGVDDDCDGTADQDFTPVATSCGVGACASTGMTTCVAGTPGDTCTPGTPAASDSTCDGVDDDCDGVADEDFVAVPTSCGVGACASTGITTCTAGVPGDTCTPGTPAASDATCDGVDDDCDGTADEDFVATPTSCGVGACASTGMTTCVAGTPGDTCTPGTPAASDGTCDGVDDDCDGTADQDFTPVATSCGVGACASTGMTTCVAGTPGDTCTPGTPAPSDATCDGLDDDCDGAADEDFTPAPTSCGVGACTSTGMTTCVAGTPGDTCTPGAPAPSDSTCDGVDDDCDGTADEDFVAVPTSCGVGACSSTGMTTCVAGTPGDTCAPGTPAASDATCDGVDDDCDGTADEEFVATPTSCGVGACASTGITTCTGGVPGDTCTPGAPAPSDSTCDGVDDDCDGTADEDFVAVPTSCGVGVCASTGITTCTAGVPGDTCAPGAPAPSDATCDGLDDDCDGTADEDFTPVATSCGVGACASTGMTMCVAGTPGDTCTPGTPAASDATCDGVDDDCDGTADEEFVATPTSCGVGACASTGITTCIGGVLGDTCAPGTPAASDATCDGLDDDCDGTADEGFVATPTSCGVGACASTGMTTCVAGTPGDTCTPGTPAPSDTTCDGVDDDCDGTADEDFVAAPTSCGVGACASAGVTTCTGGVPGDSCAPGTPAPSDSTCDGIDDDCDGTSDENFVSGPTSCGVGACASTGFTTCTGGVLEDSCTPGAPAAEDATCDGIDDDCDSVTDEEFLPFSSSCGYGECARTGEATCEDGHLVDSCEPGEPFPEQCGDGLDSDCDGLLDNSGPEVALDLVFVDQVTLIWTASPEVTTYALYRGHLLVSGWAFDHVCQASPLGSPSAVDTEEPVLGEGYFYLVAGRNGCGEGGVGFTSTLEDRPIPSPCP
jgi:hypothetical protein